VEDDSPWIRAQLAASLGALPAGPREDLLEKLLRRAGDEPVTVDAALSSLRGSEAAMIDRLRTPATVTPQVESALTMLAATIVRSGEDAGVQTVLTATAGTATPEWQRDAMLRGLEVALLGAPAPGNAGRGSAPLNAAAGPLPCPTCPGGRGGPGGSYAFPRPAGWPTAPSRAGADLRLNAEPRTFAALARGKDAQAQRAAAVLNRIVWPGKAGAPVVAPLTAEEQARFAAGREIYRNICQGCHQPDGRGQDRIAPPIVGSPLALARADIPARILLSGKEGPIGLMPPIGSTITDEQIAAVLTYVRREWGQSGAPVSAAAIADVRRATADRNRPWKHDELMAMVGK
jgi:mono/diheme cytochrome c family protein